MVVDGNGGGAASSPAVDENLYLIGRPSLKDFLRYVRGHAANPPATEAPLTEEWRAANCIVRDLERNEAGLADDPPMTGLGPEYEPLLLEFLQDPLVRNGFNTVPSDVAMVELDRMVVYQKHIDLAYAQHLERALGPSLTPEQVFRTCLLHDHPRPPVKWSRVHQDRYVFMSPSNDLRFLGAVPLETSQIKDFPDRGGLAGVVGLTVGLGSNFLNAVYADRRLILNNGSHRAYVLRKLGITHVPCVIQHAASRDELEVVAASEVKKDPDRYLKHPRPSMLRDYFNPQLYKVMPVHRRWRQVTVRFEVEENFVPAL